MFVTVVLLLVLQLTSTTHISVISEDGAEAKFEMHDRGGEAFVMHVSGEYAYLASCRGTAITYAGEPVIQYTPGELQLSADVLIPGTLSAALQYGETEQPRLVVLETFDAAIEGWNDQRKSVCGTSVNYFLGGPCNFSRKVVRKHFAVAAPHTALRLHFQFHFLDEWEGESAQLRADGEVVW